MKTILRIVVLKRASRRGAQEKMFVGKSVNLVGKWSVENDSLCKTPGKWFGRAVSPNVAHSPGQRPGET